MAWLLQPTNSIQEARQNISSHYDTSNELFSAFLSPDLNYSCAHWSGDPAEPLESAQARKVRNLLSKAQLSSSHHVLDIGCGWGDLGIKAAQLYGCRVTGLTLSERQKSLADQRIKAAGLQDRVRILLCDYRHASGPDPDPNSDSDQGGGFYDRTLELLRGRRATLAIGFAYDGQETGALPLEETDQRLDMIVTERRVIQLG